jgi:cation transporter-like permease
VVDRAGVLLGVVPAPALLEILHREHVEDLHRLAGIARESELARDSIESPPIRRARDRLPWLLVGLCGSMLAAFVMSRYERVLQANLAIAFFVPAIVYLADAIGTQTEAVVVRGLSISRLSLRELLFAELGTGMLIGGTLGGLALPFIGLAYGDFRLAASVALAVCAAGSAATTIGLLLSWLLQRMGKDPAFGSGPLATVIQDVLSLLIYFAIATALVPALGVGCGSASVWCARSAAGCCRGASASAWIACRSPTPATATTRSACTATGCSPPARWPTRSTATTSGSARSGPSTCRRQVPRSWWRTTPACCRSTRRCCAWTCSRTLIRRACRAASSTASCPSCRS